MAIRVNGQTIPESAIQYELDRLIKFYSEYMSPTTLKSQFDVLKKKAEQQAIGAKLLIDEARRLDIKVSQNEIGARLQALIDNAGGREPFENLLRKQGISENDVRDGIEQGRRVDILVERITAGISDPSEEELQDHFKQHEQEYMKSDRAQVQHILITPASKSKADRETAKSRLEEIRRRILEEGAEFADQAAAYSDCPSGKKTGGSLGWLSKGMAVPALDKAVFSLPIGDLSDVIESHLGFHIFKKTAQEKGGKAGYPEVAENIRDFLRHTKRGLVISDFVEELKKKAVIEED